MSDENPIVGHKTYSDGRGSFTHTELRKDEADLILDNIEKRDAEMMVRWPDEKSALSAMCDAFHHLSKFGWREACYCPKDGSTFLVIEAGSSGIHEAHYQGEWPKGIWWIHSEGDLWPSRPILFKLK